jgi:hypothetical protein
MLSEKVHCLCRYSAGWACSCKLSFEIGLELVERIVEHAQGDCVDLSEVDDDLLRAELWSQVLVYVDPPAAERSPAAMYDAGDCPPEVTRFLTSSGSQPFRLTQRASERHHFISPAAPQTSKKEQS